jgi:lantibiotic modifying enzyme
VQYKQNAINFTKEYLNFLNSDILRAQAFLKEKNEQEAFNNIEEQLQLVYSNHSNFLQSIFNREGICSVSRLGDMHNLGRATVLVESQNRKFIYKPINAYLLNILRDALKLLNSSGNFKFYELKILKNSHGDSEIEFLDDQVCLDMEKFSFHYGALMTLITLLRGVDFHRENIFCVDSTPVVIDCESLFYPIIQGIRDYDIEATSMFPTRLNKESTMSKLGLPIPPIKKGIAVVCDVIRKLRDEFLQLIQDGHEINKRLIFKPTSFYYKILKSSLHITLLVDRKKRYEYIRSCLEGTHPISKAIIKSESNDLMNMDIPYFIYHQDSLFDASFCKLTQNFCKEALTNICDDIKNIHQFKNKIIERIEKL